MNPPTRPPMMPSTMCPITPRLSSPLTRYPASQPAIAPTTSQEMIPMVHFPPNHFARLRFFALGCSHHRAAGDTWWQQGGPLPQQEDHKAPVRERGRVDPRAKLTGGDEPNRSRDRARLGSI